MNWLRRVFYFFSQYTDSQERAAGLFFAGLTEHSDRLRTRTALNEQIQRNIAVINLWSEYRYKGYKYLRKSSRKKMYANLQLITNDFEQFRAKTTRHADEIVALIHSLAPHAHVNHERVVLIQALMDYFSPARGVYEYRASSSFGRLLRDPSRETLIGDCNQIVTLYIYLYSRYFDVSNLQIRLLPGHVALYYGGIDVEATSGMFMNYADVPGSSLMPIEEIASVNLLDTTDSYLDTHDVSAEDFLQASRFAFILSHDRAIVTRNLDAAYAKLINSLMSRHNFAEALKFARASRDVELLAIVGHNGAVHHIGHHNYAAARRFAEHALKRDDLIHDSYRAEGAHHYEQHRYHDAIKAFKQYGDQTLVRQCYEALYFAAQEKLGSNLTNESVKKHASTIKRMRDYAKKSGNKQLINSADHMNKYL